MQLNTKAENYQQSKTPLDSKDYQVALATHIHQLDKP
jgi:hypothetical protein